MSEFNTCTMLFLLYQNFGHASLIQKLDPISGLHTKNQREISSNKVRKLLWPFGRGKCGKGGEMV